MPGTERALRWYLVKALLLFVFGMAAFALIAHFYPAWLASFAWIPAPWNEAVNMLLGGMICGGLYTGGVWMVRYTERHGRGGIGALFNVDLYLGYMILGPLLFIPAVVIAVKRLLSGGLPETEQERIVRKPLPRK